MSRMGRLLIVLIASSLTACVAFDPRLTEAPLTASLPQAGRTTYTAALAELGLMTEIYGTPTLRVQCLPMGDLTGASLASGAEIPRDISEMLKSALNAIGGKVVFIPYDPSFIQNQTITGYGDFSAKVIPDVLLSGGITEFDRGLETRGRAVDVNGGMEPGGLPKLLPSKVIDFRANASAKSGLARLTLDFNLLDLQTMTGLSRMNVVNSLEVHKTMEDRDLGISLFGQTFGAKGSVKRVEGRHAAVRLLVELSVIQIIGRHLRLPYWQLLGEEAAPDSYVTQQIENYFRCLGEKEAVLNVQNWLALYGRRVERTGLWDSQTRLAIKQAIPEFDLMERQLTFDTFMEVYTHVPITCAAKRIRSGSI